MCSGMCMPAHPVRLAGEGLLLVSPFRHGGRMDRERGARAFRGADRGIACRASAAGEIAIGEVEARERAAEALRVGLVDIEAGMERNPVDRRAGLVALRPHGAGRKGHKANGPAAAKLNGAGNRAVTVDAPGAARAFEAREGKQLPGYELPRRFVIELLSCGRTHSGQSSRQRCQNQSNTPHDASPETRYDS